MSEINIEQQGQESEQEFYEYKAEGGKIFKLPSDFKDEFNKRLSIKEKKVKSAYDEELNKIIAE